MVLEKYDSGQIDKFREQNALDGMSICLVKMDVLERRVREGFESYDNKSTIFEVERTITDYVHFRDVAIARGADVSNLPKRIKIPQPIQK